MPSWRLAAAMAVAGAVCAGGCGPDATGAADAAQAAQSGRSVRYALGWTADATAVGQPRIVKAQFKTWSLQLVPCPHAHGDVSGWSWIAPAWAAHGVAVDPSLWIASATESVPAVEPAGLSPVREVSGTPCELLWLVSPGPPARSLSEIKRILNVYPVIHNASITIRQSPSHSDILNCPRTVRSKSVQFRTVAAV
ncbi:MAG: hypothetical protein EXR77_10495 [Myxococcales bacterium]|nr:hypothetical protein [Myxococcales bacterium]